MNNLRPDWLTNPPDWLFSPVDTVGEAIIVGTAVAIGGGLAKDVISHALKWTWNHREQIMQKLRTELPQNTVVQLVGVPSDELVGSLVAVSSERTAMWDVRANVGSERTASWNVKAPTPSPARRLEELASWYLHVS